MPLPPGSDSGETSHERLSLSPDIGWAGSSRRHAFSDPIQPPAAVAWPKAASAKAICANALDAGRIAFTVGQAGAVVFLG
jgi:hypothetical protein